MTDPQPVMEDWRILDALGEGNQEEQGAQDLLSGYRIGGKKEAAWAMENLRAYVARKAENDQVAADRIQAIKDWQEAENAKLGRSIDFFTGALKTWHMDQYALDEKHNKTISLPDGVLKRVAGRPSVVVDEDVFKPYAEDNDPTLIRWKAEPDKKALAERCKDGEIIPGVSFEPGEDSFTVKPLGSES